jgi:hypothetical protein
MSFFLSWLKRDKTESTTETVKPEYFTGKGNAIDPEWRSGWSTDESGLAETRRHVGRSVEGFHAGVEDAFRVGAGRIAWGEAQPTPEKAREAAGELERERREAIESAHERHPEMPERMRALFSEWRQDAKLARQRDETGKAPETAPAPKTRAQEQQPKRERVKSNDIHL